MQNIPIWPAAAYAFVMLMPALAGALRCQRDSYLKVLQTKVVSCEKKKDLYAVEFEDTVLFPEGGGQPFDQGLILREKDDSGSSIEVSDVQRVGLHAIHTLNGPLEPGETVTMHVDWARRLDHMQQHTGQHLLSAVLDKKNVATVGWNLGVQMNYVELDRKLSAEEVKETQLDVNGAIAEAVPITVDMSGHDEEKGAMRVVTIGEMDKNPCCGTHLAKTSEIGSILLLHQIPNKGNSRLFFMAGNRVTDYARASHDNLRVINSALSCQTDDILAKIEQLQVRQKGLASQLKIAQQELAVEEAARVKTILQSHEVYVLYKPDYDMEYLRFVEKQLFDLSGTAILLCGQGPGGGAIIIAGKDVDKYAVLVKDMFKDAKGGGKGRWQGKVVRYNNGEVEKALELNK